MYNLEAYRYLMMLIDDEFYSLFGVYAFEHSRIHTFSLLKGPWGQHPCPLTQSYIVQR